MAETITTQREKLLALSSKMSASEIIGWNEMMTNPEIQLEEIDIFVSGIQKKYNNDER